MCDLIAMPALAASTYCACNVEKMAISVANTYEHDLYGNESIDQTAHIFMVMP